MTDSAPSASTSTTQVTIGAASASGSTPSTNQSRSMRAGHCSASAGAIERAGHSSDNPSSASTLPTASGRTGCVCGRASRKRCAQAPSSSSSGRPMWVNASRLKKRSVMYCGSMKLRTIANPKPGSAANHSNSATPE
ncbi:MAG: hypothetical protein LKCHEGNO_03489 [Burkholderiaceae bacterium]|nr:hypothetical protein [Burkholderiaceae bacterium]